MKDKIHKRKKSNKNLIFPFFFITVMVAIMFFPDINTSDINLNNDQALGQNSSDILYSFPNAPRPALRSPHDHVEKGYYYTPDAIWPNPNTDWAEAEGGNTYRYRYISLATESVINVYDTMYFDVSTEPGYEDITLKDFLITLKIRAVPRTKGGGFNRIYIRHENSDGSKSWEHVLDTDFKNNWKIYTIDTTTPSSGNHHQLNDPDFTNYINNDGRVEIQIHTRNKGKWDFIFYTSPGVTVEMDLATIQLFYEYDHPIKVTNPVQRGSYNINGMIGLELDYEICREIDLEDLFYIIDPLEGGTAIKIPLDHVIPTPEPGYHEVQLLGHDSSNNSYYSQKVLILVVDEPIWITNYEILVGTVISGDIDDTYHFDSTSFRLKDNRAPIYETYGYAGTSGVIINYDIPDVRLGGIKINAEMDHYEYWAGDWMTGWSMIYFDINYMDGSQDHEGFYFGIDSVEISVDPNKIVDDFQIAYIIMRGGDDSYYISIDSVEFIPYEGGNIYDRDPEKIAVFIWASDAGIQEGIDRYANILRGEGFTVIYEFKNPENFEEMFKFIDNYEKEGDTIFLYLMGHGGIDPIYGVSAAYFNPGGEIVTSSRFRVLMDGLETSRKAHLVDSCYSGDWVNRFRSEPYFAMSSSDTEHSSYTLDGHDVPYEGAFSAHFFDHVAVGYDAIDSFYYAKGIVDASDNPQNPQLADYSSYIFFAD
ncbi:MAG: hypothetical protein ACFFBP_14255 [Promethearchaeota archaeon]